MSNTTLPAFILNIVTLSNAFLSTCISIGVLLILFLTRAFAKDVHILLCTNTYLVIFAYSMLSGSLYLDALRGDLGLTFETEVTNLCRIRGSLVLALFSAMFGAFCLQAFFRLCRVVYHQYLILQRYHIQLCLIAFKWALSLAFVWFVQIDYLPAEHYCSIPFNSLKPILTASAVAYGLPSTLLALIYFRIARYIRLHQQTLRHRHRNRRDVAVIRRTVVIVSILWTLGIPSMILVLYGYVRNGDLHPLTYRIEWLAPSAAVLVLSVVLIRSDPRLMKAVFSQPSKASRSIKTPLQPVIQALLWRRRLCWSLFFVRLAPSLNSLSSKAKDNHQCLLIKLTKSISRHATIEFKIAECLIH